MDGSDRIDPTLWQAVTGSGQLPARLSASSTAVAVQRNLRNLQSASAAEVTLSLGACLALVAGSGMGDDARDEWLDVAKETLRGIPLDLLERGCAAARRRADHPSKVVPAIMAEVGDAWGWRRAEASAALDNRHAAPAKQTCTPAEAAEICKRFKVGSYARAQAAGERRPERPGPSADTRRPCRAPTRDDYLRMGVPVEVLDRLAALEPQSGQQAQAA